MANAAETAPPSAPQPAPAPRRSTAQAMDPWLFFAAMALACIGLVMVYSSSAWLARETTGSWEHYLNRQGMFLGVGLAVMIACSRLDYRVLRRFAPHLMGIGLVVLIVVLFVGRDVNGARRWISLGPVNLQPSEIAKVALAIFLAATLARQGERVRSFKRGFLPVMIAAGLTMLLVYLERDLGTTILLGSLTLILLFVAGTRASYVLAAIMLAVPVVWSRIMNVDYRRGRLESFFSGDDYQVQQSLVAIGSGGPWGVGLGNGRQKLGFLPEDHTDFILATTGEELGLVGISMVIGLFGLLVWRGLVAARQAPDRFGTYLATGLSAVFGLQALVNMAVVLRVIPAKGITLPFMSYGGSSLLVSMASVGLLLSISRRPDPWKISDQRRRRGNKPRKERGKPAKTRTGARPNVRKPTLEPASA
jgi:cell division protein FtsW